MENNDTNDHIPAASVAASATLRSPDHLLTVRGQEVFCWTHNEVQGMD
jgi:hypothetical protein